MAGLLSLRTEKNDLSSLPTFTVYSRETRADKNGKYELASGAGTEPGPLADPDNGWRCCPVAGAGPPLHSLLYDFARSSSDFQCLRGTGHDWLPGHWGAGGC